MTQFTNKGTAAKNRALHSKAKRGQRGAARLSKQMGAGDPRHRRNATNQQVVDKQLGAGLTYDKQGRLTTEGA